MYNLLTDCKYTMLCPPEINMIRTFALSVLAENRAVTSSKEVRRKKEEKHADTTPPVLTGLPKSSH